ncbi:hypothetical protein GPA19_18610 [Azoarcus indigens]|nr:hypothetical protein [Azoarcus indigens]
MAGGGSLARPQPRPRPGLAARRSPAGRTAAPAGRARPQRPRTPSPRRRQLLRLAWIPALPAGWLAWRQVSVDGNRWQSATGEQRPLTLADGSRLLLNTATEVVVRFDAQMRLIRLLTGEILATSAPDPQARPLIVATADGFARTLGTRFSVRRGSGEDSSRITVFEGAVEVEAGGQIARGGRVGMLANQDVFDTPFAMTSYTAELIENQQARTVADVVVNNASTRLMNPNQGTGSSRRRRVPPRAAGSTPTLPAIPSPPICTPRCAPPARATFPSRKTRPRRPNRPTSRWPSPRCRSMATTSNRSRPAPPHPAARPMREKCLRRRKPNRSNSAPSWTSAVSS